MRLFCFDCGKSVTNELPDDTIFRAIATCPECLEKAETKTALERPAPEQTDLLDERTAGILYGLRMGKTLTIKHLNRFSWGVDVIPELLSEFDAMIAEFTDDPEHPEKPEPPEVK